MFLVFQNALYVKASLMGKFDLAEINNNLKKDEKSGFGQNYVFLPIWYTLTAQL